MNFLNKISEIMDDLEHAINQKLDFSYSALEESLDLFSKNYDLISSKAQDIIDSNLENYAPKIPFEGLREIKEAKHIQQCQNNKKMHLYSAIEDSIRTYKMIPRAKQILTLEDEEFSYFKNRAASRSLDPLLKKIENQLYQTLDYSHKNLFVDEFDHISKDLQMRYYKSQVPHEETFSHVHQETIQENDSIVDKNLEEGDFNKDTFNQNKIVIKDNNTQLIDPFAPNHPKFEISYQKNIFTNHTSGLNCILVLNPKLVLTASQDCSIRLWKIEKPEKPIFILEGHTQPVMHLQKINKPGSKSSIDCYVISISTRGKKTVILWDMFGPKPKIVSTNEAFNSSIITLSVLSKFEILVCTQNGEISVLDIPSLSKHIVLKSSMPNLKKILVMSNRRNIVISGKRLLKSGLADFSNLKNSARLSTLKLVREQKEDTTYHELKQVGINSQFFAGFGIDTKTKIFRFNNLDCVRVIRGRNAMFGGCLSINLFSKDSQPEIYFLSIDSKNENFLIASPDQKYYEVIENKMGIKIDDKYGCPSVQILRMRRGEGFSFFTICERKNSKPSLTIWDLKYIDRNFNKDNGNK